MAASGMCRGADGGNRCDEFVGDLSSARASDLRHRNGDLEHWLSIACLALGELCTEALRLKRSTEPGCLPYAADGKQDGQRKPDDSEPGMRDGFHLLAAPKFPRINKPLK